MTQYKLTYYNIRGFAEVPRLIFALAEVSYEDYRIPYTQPPGEHNKIPDEIKEKCPYGQIPILEVSGDGIEPRIICQSAAIARYLARKFGKFYGANDEEKAIIDDVIDGVKDYSDTFRAILLAKDDEVAKTKAVDHVMEVSTPRFLGRFNKLLLTGGDSGFLVGNSISLADIFVYNILITVSGLGLNVTKDYPELQSLVQKIGNIQQIKDWVDKRPVTAF